MLECSQPGSVTDELGGVGVLPRAVRPSHLGLLIESADPVPAQARGGCGDPAQLGSWKTPEVARC